MKMRYINSHFTYLLTYSSTLRYVTSSPADGESRCKSLSAAAVSVRRCRYLLIQSIQVCSHTGVY